MKRIALVFLLVFCALSMTFAQKTVSGTITDDNGLPVVGATVLVKGSNAGTFTASDGKFSIEVPEGFNEIEVRYTGFASQILDVTGKSTVNVTMESIVLDEVVITALGIEKQARSLGYSVDEIDSDELLKARSSNVINSLQGKVTGVQINNSGGNLGASSKIIIRGATSLSGRNNPLWVIDGMPFNDNQFITGSRITGNRDFGNGAAVVNPDDIESISILKGAAATALYGSRAAAGAIIVTTKKGKATQNGAVRVEVNSSYRFDELMVIPDYQQDYAMGSQFKYDSTSLGFDWGPRNVGQTVTLPVTGERGPLPRIADNGIREFFETGNTFINNFAISDGDERMDYRLSLGSLNQTGVIPGTQLDRYTISLNAGVRHNDKLSSRFGIQYINTNTVGTAAAGANDPNIIDYNSFSSNLDPNVFRPWIDDLGNQINQLEPTSNNPYWIRNENRNDRKDNRLLANFQMTFTPIENLSFTGKFGYDFNQDNRFLSNRKGTAQRITGNFTVDNINNNQLNTDIIGTYKFDLTPDLRVNVLGGFNYNKREFSSETLSSTDLLVPELFSPGNSETNVPTRGFSEQVLFGAYGSIDLNFRDYLTLTVTGRNDWSSTLPIENNSYFYPSVSTAFVFSDAFNLTSGFFSYGKLRASYAQVGNDTGPYQLDFIFSPVSSASGQYSLNVNFPFDGRLAYTKGNTIPPAALLPEQQISFEVGAELRFFDDRLGIDVAYFSSQNKDQILRVPIPQSTGFGGLRANAGQVNTSGFEFTVDATPLFIDDFRWNTIVNFSAAKTEVVELADGVDRLLLASAFNSVQVVAVAGGEIELLAVPWLKDEATGRPIINPLDGTRQAGEATTFGSVLPDFNMGFVNSFTWKDLNLSFTIDWRSGGVMKSSTVEGLQEGGLVTETLLNREGTFIDRQGVLENPDGTFRDNDIPLASAEVFWNSIGTSSIAEPFIFDASFVKLREVALTYSLPQSLIGNSFIKGLSIGAEARNVALLWANVPHIDPETNLFGSGADGWGVERSNVSATRSIGANVRLTF